MIQAVNTTMGYMTILGVEMFVELGKANMTVEAVDRWTTSVGNKVN